MISQRRACHACADNGDVEVGVLSRHKIVEQYFAVTHNGLMSIAATDSPRSEFYERLRSAGLSPLWEVLHNLVPPAPNTACALAHWRYRDVRPLVMEAGDLISAAEAERRVLVLGNPAYPGQSRITNSLYAGLQLIRPGEIARAHRHSQSALRFVVEGSGAFTAVDGEKAFMERGDLILTPPWQWHDHGCEADTPTIWLDGLDLPMVAYFAAGFAQPSQVLTQEASRPVGDARARFGANMAPLDWRSSGMASPVFHYPYAQSREALERMRRAEGWDDVHGLKMRYINPMTGADALPTMSTFLQLLPKGFRGEHYRSTEASVYFVVEGVGSTQLGSTTLEWTKDDIFVVPNWIKHAHVSSEDAVLFSFSDRVVHEKLGFWREQRGETVLVD
jgi:gentisate 1,2-dioxygenase